MGVIEDVIGERGGTRAERIKKRSNLRNECSSSSVCLASCYYALAYTSRLHCSDASPDLTYREMQNNILVVFCIHWLVQVVPHISTPIPPHSPILLFCGGGWGGGGTPKTNLHLFNTKQDFHNLNTGYRSAIDIPHYRPATTGKSFKINSVQVYKMLPETAWTTYNNFKTKVYSYFLKNRLYSLNAFLQTDLVNFAF